MAGDSQLSRQWHLLRMLSARRLGVTLQEMERETGASQKTLRRDLTTLQSVGFPVESEDGPRGRKTWRVRYSGNETAASFNIDELAALYLGRCSLDPLAGTVIGDAARQAMQKVRAGLSDGAVSYLDQLARSFHLTAFGQGDYASKAELIEELRAGVDDNRITILLYRSLRSTEPVTYEVYPLGIVFHRGSMYLVAWSVDHGEVRTFKMDRVQDAEVQGLQFTLPDKIKTFDLQKFFASTFGVYEGHGPAISVRILFAADVARHVEESRWHASQCLTHQRDGSITAEFKLSSLEEVKGWVLSFGDLAEVLEPQELREDIAETLRAALSSYKTEAAITQVIDRRSRD